MEREKEPSNSKTSFLWGFEEVLRNFCLREANKLPVRG